MLPTVFPVFTPGPKRLKSPSIRLITSNPMPDAVFPTVMAFAVFTPEVPLVTLFQYLPNSSGFVVNVLPKSNNILDLKLMFTVSFLINPESSETENSKI